VMTRQAPNLDAAWYALIKVAIRHPIGRKSVRRKTRLAPVEFLSNCGLIRVLAPWEQRLMDLVRMVFDRLNREEAPDAVLRAQIYDECRAEIAAQASPADRDKALEALEKVIRRQEMQAVYEDGLIGRK